MGYRLVTGGVQVRDDLRPDEPGAADDCDPHDTPFVEMEITLSQAHMPYMPPYAGVTCASTD
ncbi:hypothetical protein GCM10018787_41200 [Streptomyces thermodiastaticus]|nr:hypothetical protein GCM10018787_41200 [Streptomyces thermodiastaticus]